MNPEDFEKLSQPDKAAAISAHQAEMVWYGNCTKCGHRIVGKIGDIVGQPCPKCGHA